MPLTRLIAFICIALPMQLSAEMSGEAFDAYTQGKTLFFVEDGQPYGAEEYLPNRRVRWSFLDGQCQNGTWYEDAGAICFVYENDFGPQCWKFSTSPRGLIAQFVAENGQEIYEAQDLGREMVCLGPEIGV